MEKYLKKTLILCCALLLNKFSFAGNTKTEIEFKGKKSLHYSEVCAEKGEKKNILEFRKDSSFFWHDVYSCHPNFTEYGGEPLIKQQNRSCDSSIEYEPISGKVIRILISYQTSSFEKILETVSEKYGKPIISLRKDSPFPEKNYTWKDNKGGYIFLSLTKELNINTKEDARYCSTLSINTYVMQKLLIDIDGKIEAVRKNKIKNDSEKL
jgi:hypothetical protein